jgi:hypothetical protein
VSIDPRGERKEIDGTIVVPRYWFSVLDSFPGSAFVLRAGLVRASDRLRRRAARSSGINVLTISRDLGLCSTLLVMTLRRRSRRIHHCRKASRV